MIFSEKSATFRDHALGSGRHFGLAPPPRLGVLAAPPTIPPPGAAGGRFALACLKASTSSSGVIVALSILRTTLGRESGFFSVPSDVTAVATSSGVMVTALRPALTNRPATWAVGST